MDKEKQQNVNRWIMIVCTIPLLLLSAWSGFEVYKYSNERADINDDFTEINNIYYGILSVNSWEKHIRNIATNQIENFEITEEQDSILRIQINEILNDMITKAHDLILANDETFKDKLRKFAVKNFVDLEKLRVQIPEFTETIMANIKNPETKERFQILAQGKLDELTRQTYDSVQDLNFDKVYVKYGVEDKEAFNEIVLTTTEKLEKKAYNYAYLILGVVVLFLLLWFVIWKKVYLRKPFFILSLLLAFIVLAVGLSSPMIEIDARIGEFNFVLLGEHIVFTNQMLFYRSKSILQVVNILLQSNQFDSILVGVLILAFSVILPFSKMICNGWYLLSEKIRNNKLVQWLAFSSGKWSMADVMVVAIFMSYVAFDGILDSQLQLLERNTETVKSLTTNNTALKAGFILFLVYVLYSLILSEALKKIIKKRKEIPA